MADYRNRVAGLLFDEGSGVSNDPRDNASKFPVPDGTGNHTNKGVTWAAFSMLGPKLGFKATPALFYKMPKNIWLKIWKVGFWDQVQGDRIKSQAIADMVSDIAFNSGASRAAKLTQRALNKLGAKPQIPENSNFGPLTLKTTNEFSRTRKKEVDLLQQIAFERLSFYKSLDDWPTYKNGWTNRVNRLVEEGLKTISKPKVAGLFFLGLATTIGIIIYNEKRLNK